MPIVYRGQRFDACYRMDVWVDETVIIENKTVDSLLPIHEAQLITYLKLSGCKLGFLLNWNVTLMKQGIKSIVHGMPATGKYPSR